MSADRLSELPFGTADVSWPPQEERQQVAGMSVSPEEMARVVFSTHGGEDTRRVIGALTRIDRMGARSENPMHAALLLRQAAEFAALVGWTVVPQEMAQPQGEAGGMPNG